MSRYFITLLIYLSLSLTTSAHPVYVSMCQLSITEDREYLDLTVTIFSDDLELAIFEQDSIRLYLGSDGQIDKSSEYVLGYVAKHVSISVNKQELGLSSASCELLDIRKARTKIRFRLPLPQAPSILSMENTLLLDAIDGQVNMLRLNIAGERKAASMDSKETAVSFNIAGSG